MLERRSMLKALLALPAACALAQLPRVTQTTRPGAAALPADPSKHAFLNPGCTNAGEWHGYPAGSLLIVGYSGERLPDGQWHMTAVISRWVHHDRRIYYTVIDFDEALRGVNWRFADPFADLARRAREERDEAVYRSLLLKK